MPTGPADVAPRVRGRRKSEAGGGTRGLGVATRRACVGVSDGAGPPENPLTRVTLRKSGSYNTRWL